MDSRKILISSNETSSSPARSQEEFSQFRVVDKRHFTPDGADAIAGGLAEEKPRYPTFVEELIARKAETERRYSEKVKQIDQELARTKSRLEADYQRRLAKDKQDLLLPFIDVLDNLERALKSAAAAGSKEYLLEGLKMTVALFRARLASEAVEPVEVLNQPFDPNLSQAIGVVPVADSARDGLVVEELLRGYRMGDVLLRPAQVRVARYQQHDSSSNL